MRNIYTTNFKLNLVFRDLNDVFKDDIYHHIFDKIYLLYITSVAVCGCIWFTVHWLVTGCGGYWPHLSGELDPLWKCIRLLEPCENLDLTFTLKSWRIFVLQAYIIYHDKQATNMCTKYIPNVQLLQNSWKDLKLFCHHLQRIVHDCADYCQCKCDMFTEANGNVFKTLFNVK